MDLITSAQQNCDSAQPLVFPRSIIEWSERTDHYATRPVCHKYYCWILPHNRIELRGELHQYLRYFWLKLSLWIRVWEILTGGENTVDIMHTDRRKLTTRNRTRGQYFCKFRQNQICRVIATQGLRRNPFIKNKRLVVDCEVATPSQRTLAYLVEKMNEPFLHAVISRFARQSRKSKLAPTWNTGQQVGKNLTYQRELFSGIKSCHTERQSVYYYYNGASTSCTKITTKNTDSVLHPSVTVVLWLNTSAPFRDKSTVPYAHCLPNP